MERLKNLDDLVRFMEQNNFPFALDREHNTVELPSKAAPLPGNLFVRWYSSAPLVSFFHFMVENVPDDRVAEVETAIARVNNAYDLPGFGFDHQGKRVYYRWTIPVFVEEGITPVAFNGIGHSVVRQAKEATQAFLAVVNGRPGAEIMAIMAEKTPLKPST